MVSEERQSTSAASSESERTLAHAHAGNEAPKLQPEAPRTYATAEELDDQAQAEREYAEWGGDAPAPLGRVQRDTRRRMSTSGAGGRQRTRSRSESLPHVYLVDSAFSDSHRVMSRISRQERQDSGGKGK